MLTIEAKRASGAVNDQHLERVSVGTTLMEKSIAYPTDTRLYESEIARSPSGTTVRPYREILH